MPFQRALSDEIINKLKKDQLFKDCLLPDIRSKGVFPAIRNESVAFYYKGGGLFTYSNDRYKTHFKYGIIPKNIQNPYVSENDLCNVSFVTSFNEGYQTIKERCKLYGGVEAESVSTLYRRSGVSYDPSNPSNHVLMLDTEVCFNSWADTPDKKTDRIDILLYDTVNKQLCFCEAKHFSNKELWAREGITPKVCSQISRYNERINKLSSDILSQYIIYIDLFNKLFDTSIPSPNKVFNKTGLLIFGYDSNQKNKIDELLINDDSLKGIPYYTTGSLKGNQISTLYDTITK